MDIKLTAAIHKQRRCLSTFITYSFNGHSSGVENFNLAGSTYCSNAGRTLVGSYI